MSKKTKIICSSLSIITGIGLLYFIFKNYKNYADWWLDKIGLWFGTDSLFVKYLIANMLDVAVPIMIIVIIVFIIAVINKIKRR